MISALHTTPRSLVLAALAAIGLASHAGAQVTYNWSSAQVVSGNANTALNGSTAVNGSWSEGAKWYVGNTATNGTVPTSADNAVFGAMTAASVASRAITLDSNFSVNSLTMLGRSSNFSNTTSNVTISGASTLTLGAGGLTVGAGGTFTISSNLALSADQTWTTTNESGVGALAVTGIISGPGKITRTANSGNGSTQSVATFSGANTFSGGFQQNTSTNVTRLGSSSTTSGGVILDGPLGTGTVTLNTGTLSSNGGTARSLSNNIVIGGTVNLGNSAQTGALTFSDVGVTTPTTFALGSANNHNVSTLRVGGTNLIFDQAISQTGGTNQSVNFASTSGTPTVTINRTKTATGNILSGGVALVLNNGAVNSGSIIAVNGSVTATGSNKFSSGSLISDNAALIATDATNYSAVSGGKAIVYNNGRASFATDQTQATVASLFTADSQVRLGLSSAALSPTVSENYNQSLIGNGRAGLVSASTGTVTYTGSLTSGNDNTFRVGGGLGTLAFTGSTLTGASKNVIVEGGGTVNASADQNYTGTTTVNSALTLSGSGGALSATSGIAINNTSVTLDNTTANANRLANSAGITLNRGTLAMNGSTTAISEAIGTLTVNSGFNTISMGTAPGAANTKSITTNTLARTAGSVALFRGDNFGLAAGGGSALTRNLFIVNTAPTGVNFVGGGGANGTTNMSITPWARTGTGTTATGGNFLTYDSSNNSLRALTTAEFATNVDTAVNNTDNVRQAIAASGTTTLLTADRTRNSFILQNAGATAAGTGSLGGFTLTITSGAVDLSHTVAQNFTLNNGTLAFGTAEGVITNSGGSSSLTSVGAIITGSNGVTIMANNGGTLGLAGVNTFTGGLTVGSNGNAAVAVDQDVRFGNAANAVTHAGGILQFFSTFTTTRGLTLLGNVGNNTLANNTTSNTMNWNGNITGAGLLRLINNASTSGAGGFSLGGANDYSGGTQIEGINVTGTTNTAFGTGTVTLIGANNNPAALTLTGTAPTLGGLRGTDGTVTISPTAATATLSVGSNNENTVFNGVIAQGASKTASLAKTGTGTLVLGGNSTYTGTTTVTGKLSVNGSLASSAVTVQNLGTLAGTGLISGTVTVQDGGTLAPGNSIESIAVGATTFDNGSTYSFELDASVASNVGADLLAVTGNVTLGGVVTLSLSELNAGTFADNTKFTLISYSGSLTGLFTYNSTLLTDGSDFSFDGKTWNINYDDTIAGSNFTSDLTSPNYVTITAIPEPSTWAMILGGFGALVGVQHLRRRRNVS